MSDELWVDYLRVARARLLRERIQAFNIAVMAAPGSEEAANNTNERVAAWREEVEDLLMQKTEQERADEKKARYRSAWNVIRGATRMMKQRIIDGAEKKKKKPVLKIDFDSINRKRKAWQANSTRARSSPNSSSLEGTASSGA